MDKDFCNSVLPIPQYQNTCWFTTALMCILRSQHSRRFLLNNLKINDKSPKVIKMIYKLLMKTYIANPKTYEYYKKFNASVFEMSRIVQHLRMAMRRLNAMMVSMIYTGLTMFRGMLNTIQFIIKVILTICGIMLGIMIILIFVLFPFIPMILAVLGTIVSL